MTKKVDWKESKSTMKVDWKRKLNDDESQYTYKENRLMNKVDQGTKWFGEQNWMTRKVDWQR